MKKHILSVITCLFIFFLLTFSLVSCNLPGLIGNFLQDIGSGGYQNTDLPSYLPSSLSASLNDDTVFGKLSEEEKQTIIADAKKEGSDVFFSSDGTMTVKNENGTSAVQHPNGSWSVIDEDGTAAQYGGEWPVNEFTNLVPKPDFKLLAAVLEETEFAASFQGGTKDELKAYAQAVKEAGFTIDPTETDESMLGMEVYAYIASNADGYSVTLSYAIGTIAFTITKG